MRVSILTLFPSMFTGFVESSIISKAIERDLIQVDVVDMRDFTEDKHNRVDDYPYGGGAGLVLMCQPVIDAIEATRTEGSLVIMLTPQGKTLKQSLAYDLRKESHIILVCGHYEGFDERIRSYVDMEMSIGDYVLTGGETAAMVIADSVIRLVDGVITKESHEDDSFSDGLLEYPHYTRPRSYKGQDVPEVLMSGHHANIETYRLKESLRKTYRVRPDLLESRNLSPKEAKLLQEVVEEEN
ncbi:tRNA (guanosine(37)-N1)-methyltransferase TrmD [Erysipelothrix rhusiopathiae]|nr:tRNA (guanosine(37)-N1)-methyltransferase TrmD [Erysipelothrix rhusiopathiae]MDE8119250.1 tRNA (guanosine(37)-N1)-methyltransferase TrmD [Erysipelothrix rhusiopathiae]MDE8132798.1 tRNA (guanosine(37)-N1)-methyltransferase TrmD [Erysipelothrix rhusiopathiae]MDE8146901.1 tRNA (guanosine(37)-N1)-methyltransferase TrmD [Erysipelothrix rhusiopathiae]MDE8162694.1 tRNA (guanosine(37)-N1)-methyltransferase TrmD [Erysipelothrix rhusiopathiae]